jgi:hypothetical protein
VETNHHPEQERIAYLEKKIQTKDEVLAELMAEYVTLKELGKLTGFSAPHDRRDEIVDFVRRWSEKTEIGAGRLIRFVITASKFYGWRERYGKVNEHKGWVPLDLWLEDWEKQAIIAFHLKNPLEGGEIPWSNSAIICRRVMASRFVSAWLDWQRSCSQVKGPITVFRTRAWHREDEFLTFVDHPIGVSLCTRRIG